LKGSSAMHFIEKMNAQSYHSVEQMLEIENAIS